MSTVGVDRSARHVTTGLGRSRLRIIALSYSRISIFWILRLRRGQEIDDEAPDEEDVDERYDPLENGADVVVAESLRDAEDDGEGDFGQDEGEFDPEGDAQDAVLAEVDAEALVLGADEDGGDDVAQTKYTVSTY